MAPEAEGRRGRTKSGAAPGTNQALLAFRGNPVPAGQAASWQEEVDQLSGQGGYPQVAACPLRDALMTLREGT
jgi:hypothetical protein